MKLTLAALTEVVALIFAAITLPPDTCRAQVQPLDRSAPLNQVLIRVYVPPTCPLTGTAIVPLLRSILERYRREGAWVALDDLGSGHSSLTYLKELRPDLVKLDRALIKGLHESPAALHLITALARYAHDLDIRVVAEGIEQREELEAVSEAGVDFVQGYFLGRPSEVLGGVAPGAKACW